MSFLSLIKYNLIIKIIAIILLIGCSVPKSSSSIDSETSSDSLSNHVIETDTETEVNTDLSTDLSTDTTLDSDLITVVNTVTKWAVVVGISDYTPVGLDDNDLGFCDDDATDWYNHLVDKGYKPENISVFGDTHASDYPSYTDDATKSNVLEGIANVVSLADEDDIITFTSSGHGFPGEDQETLGTYSLLGMLDDEFIDSFELAEAFEPAVAERIFIFLDSCNSGGHIPQIESLDNADKIFMTTTCSKDGLGWDADILDVKNGLWTYWFLENGLIDHFLGERTNLETSFDWSSENYPFQLDIPSEAKHAPVQYDGNSSSDFYFWDGIKSNIINDNVTLAFNYKMISASEILNDKIVSATQINLLSSKPGKDSATVTLKPALIDDLSNMLDSSQALSDIAPRCTFDTRLKYYDSVDNLLGTVGLCSNIDNQIDQPAVFIQPFTNSRMGIQIPDRQKLNKLINSDL